MQKVKIMSFLKKKCIFIDVCLLWYVLLHVYYMSRDMTKSTKWLCAQRRLRSAWASAVFAVRVEKPWVLSYPLSAQRRLWSDWADAQADLSLRWAHPHLVGFVMSWLICTIGRKYKNKPLLYCFLLFSIANLWCLCLCFSLVRDSIATVMTTSACSDSCRQC